MLTVLYLEYYTCSGYTCYGYTYYGFLATGYVGGDVEDMVRGLLQVKEV